MTPLIFIAIPVFNRSEIAEQCIPTVRDGIQKGHDALVVYDDGSDGFISGGIRPYADGIVQMEHVGIEEQRRMHFRLFFSHYIDYTHLYLTDSDALHDPFWRTQALYLQEKYEGAPVCLYNTQAHVRLHGNTIEDDPNSEVIWRRFAPGISYLLTREHVAKVMVHIDSMQNWDWDVPRILGHRMAISRVSYVDHIGRGGMHHPESEGLDGGDRALNPTNWLVDKRKEVVAKLSA